MHLPDTVAMLMCQLRAGLRLTHLFRIDEPFVSEKLGSESDFVSF